jgi:putative RecB family exonuclease
MSTDLLNRETLKERGKDVWAYISPSRLNCWLSCPLKFKLRYVDGIRTPTTASLFLGKVVHSGLELFYRHRQLGITLETEQATARMLASWNQAVEDEGIKFDTPEKEETIRAQAVALVTAYLDQVSPDEKPLAVEAAVEAPLVDPTTGEDLGISLVGIMDLVLNGAAGPIIIDFKTAARGGQLLEITNEIQLTAYGHAYRHAAGAQEGELQIRRLIKTKQPKIETHSYPARTEAHFRRLFGVIRAYLDDLDSGRFVYRPGFSCSFCDYRDGPCRTFSD